MKILENAFFDSNSQALEEMELIKNLSFDAIATIDATSVEHVKASLAKLGEEADLGATKKAGLHVLKQLCKPFLLIIDNADDPDLRISDLIPKNKHCFVIITTRNLSSCQIPTARSLKLQGIKPDESRQLLLACAGMSESTDDATVTLGNELCELMGHLALALVVAGRYIHNDFYHTQPHDYLEAYKLKRGAYRSDIIEKGIAYPTFKISFAYLRKQHSQSCRDAIEILNIISFL